MQIWAHEDICILYMCIWHTTMPSSKQICCLHLPNSFLFFLFRELNNRSLSFLTFSALRNDGPRDGAGGAGADVVGSRSSIARDRHRNLTRSPIVVTPNLLRSASDSDCMSWSSTFSSSSVQPDFFKHVNYWRRHAALNWISARFSLFKRTSLDDDKEVTTA